MSPQTAASSPSPSPSPSPRERLRRMSRWMQALVACGAAGLLLTPAWVALGDPQELAAQMQGLPGVIGRSPPLPYVWLSALAALPGVLLGLFALWQVWQLFAAYGRGTVFGSEPTGRLRRLGWALVAAAPMQPLTNTLLVLALTLNNPPGQRRLVLGAGSNDYLALLVGGLLLAIAWAMAEGTRIEQENEGFV